MREIRAYFTSDYACVTFTLYFTLQQHHTNNISFTFSVRSLSFSRSTRGDGVMIRPLYAVCAGPARMTRIFTD
ncbi:Hypothetical protein ETEE_2143 [Edwardsiella anguillarum ET080813]|uniref:Uncharacterized protein n=1 Tax=Edwardsiella anguillarum ET080813 TaxID=667120 RepID=A0A076LPE5_9GAMM|nr:Hypothetical protein ETEE_2143 [Edwardsiella anguillarum ET080813]